MKFCNFPGSARSLRRIVICWSLLTLSVACSNEPGKNDGGGSSTVVATPTKAPDQSPPAELPGATPIEPAEAELDSAEQPYTVDCDQQNDAGEKFCLVDNNTYIGWRTYHGFCHVCHAQDAVGSTFAPSLVESLQNIDKARFLHVVAEGYTGQVGVMPPWEDNPNVSKRYEELYAYLKARSDGALARGRPKKKP